MDFEKKISASLNKKEKTSEGISDIEVLKKDESRLNSLRENIENQEIAAQDTREALKKLCADAGIPASDETASETALEDAKKKLQEAEKREEPEKGQNEEKKGEKEKPEQETEKERKEKIEERRKKVDESIRHSILFAQSDEMSPVRTSKNGEKVEKKLEAKLAYEVMNSPHVRKYIEEGEPKFDINWRFKVATYNLNGVERQYITGIDVEVMKAGEPPQEQQKQQEPVPEEEDILDDEDKRALKEAEVVKESVLKRGFMNLDL